MILVELNGAEVAVFNIDGEFYALADVYTHDGGMLADGSVEVYEIESPRHGARFDIRTGKITAPPAYEDVTAYLVLIVDGSVKVKAVYPD